MLPALAGPVAAAGAGVFAVSTFETDYLFIKEAEVQTAVAALGRVDHSVEEILP